MQLHFSRVNIIINNVWISEGGLDATYVKIEHGRPKTINCSVTGKPPPNVHWSRLTDGDYRKLNNASKGHSLLEFDPFKESDAGKYLCSASYLDVETNWIISVKVDDGKLCFCVKWCVNLRH